MAFDLYRKLFVSGLKKQGDTLLLQVVELYLPSEKVTMHDAQRDAYEKYLKYKVTIYSIVMTLQNKSTTT